MNLYSITRVDEFDYDEHDAAIICCASEHAARCHAKKDLYPEKGPCWDDAVVKLIGRANADVEAGVVLNSFNAG